MRDYSRIVPRRAPSEATKTALAVLRAAVARGEAEERAKLKARQDAGKLTPGERLLAAIFGEI
jgi:hypothetical protein